MDNITIDNIQSEYIKSPELEINPLFNIIPEFNNIFFQNNMGMIAVGTLLLLFVIIGVYAYKTNKLNEIQEYLLLKYNNTINSISKLWCKKSVKFAPNTKPNNENGEYKNGEYEDGEYENSDYEDGDYEDDE